MLERKKNNSIKKEMRVNNKCLNNNKNSIDNK